MAGARKRPKVVEMRPRKARSDKGSVMQELQDVEDALSAVARRLSEALVDGELDTRERSEVATLAVRLRRQVDELLDALERGKP